LVVSRVMILVKPLNKDPWYFNSKYMSFLLFSGFKRETVEIRGPEKHCAIHTVSSC
jgi:hypothetical protein